MDKKLQVFVSSTYTDLKDERQAVVSEILEAGHIPAGMELFAAGDKTMLETIKRWIENSDVFVLILGGRYGSIEPESGKSYTEVEYEYANSIDKPHLAAVIHDSLLDQKVSEHGRGVLERDHVPDYDRFKATVKEKQCGTFTNMDTLKLIVSHSLREIERTRSLVGWVRADSVANPAPLIDRIGELQKENNELRKQLGEANQNETFHGYSFQEVYDRLNAAPVQIPEQFQKLIHFPPSISVLALFWNFRKAYCSGIRSDAAGPFAWLLGQKVAVELMVYGFVESKTSTEIQFIQGVMYKMGEQPPQGPVRVIATTITDVGRRFLSMVDRDEQLKAAIPPIADENAVE